MMSNGPYLMLHPELIPYFVQHHQKIKKDGEKGVMSTYNSQVQVFPHSLHPNTPLKKPFKLL